MNTAEGFLGFTGDTWFALLVGAAFTAIVAFTIYFLQRTPKRLGYAIGEIQDLTPPDDPTVWPRLEMTWTTKPPAAGLLEPKREVIRSPKITRVYVRNIGRKAVDQADFTSPITFEVEDGVIVDVNVIEVSHEGIFPIGSLSGADHVVTEVTPVLLNPGDWIAFRVVTDESTYAPILKSWIREESKPMKLMSEQMLLEPGRTRWQMIWDGSDARARPYQRGKKRREISWSYLVRR